MGTNIAGAHDDSDRILRGVERGVILEVRDAVHVQPAAVFRAVDLLPQGVHSRGLQVGPSSSFVKGNDSADNGLILRLGFCRVALFHRGARGALLGLVRRLGLGRGPLGLARAVRRLRPQRLLDVGQVDTIQALDLVELAVPATALGADVVGEGQRVADAFFVGDVNVPGVGSGTLSAAVVHVQDNHPFGRVQDNVRLLVNLFWQLRLVELVASIIADHQVDCLADPVFELDDHDEAMGDEELVPHVHQAVDRAPRIVRVRKVDVL
mmetsp:Transcript_101062/g.294263  ORF Transcript_101062/g.294263 Transcript_101062/m.294263 type:complete len:266 (-) Transcript_101062:775-1572(-)